MTRFKKARSLRWIAGLLASLLLLAACGGPSAAETAKDQEIATLKAQLADAQQVSTYWQQLTNVIQPVSMASMSDHRAHMLSSGVVMALHFDNMDLGKAKNLNWVALGIPGNFCKTDQERVTQQFGEGFTHFHDMQNDTHGGAPGAEGVWFVHTAVRDFEAPWGAVKTGIDTKFMPTAAPDC